MTSTTTTISTAGERTGPSTTSTTAATDRNDNQAIPVVDLTSFTTSDLELATPSSRRDTAEQIREVLSQNGSMGITGHGIPKLVLDEAFAWSKRLFDLPYETKMLAPHPDAPMPHRGYSGIGREQGGKMMAVEGDGERDAKVAVMKDFKESFEFGHPDNKINYNILLPEEVLPGFQKFMLSFQDDLNKLTHQIMDALIMSLNLPEREAATARALLVEQENNIRLAHYPAVSEEVVADKTTSRLGAHRDWSIYTLLFQDQNSGLEFHDGKTDTFIPATPQEGVMYFNVGDMFHRFSNGIYPSALHRVVIPTGTKGQPSKARYSIPFFVAASPDAVVGPSPSLVAECGRQVYEPVLFDEYSTRMFEATNLYG